MNGTGHVCHHQTIACQDKALGTLYGKVTMYMYVKLAA